MRCKRPINLDVDLIHNSSRSFIYLKQVFLSDVIREREKMGPIDPDGSDTKAIVTASPSSAESSPNAASTHHNQGSNTGDDVVTITITGADGSHATNGAASSAPSAPPASMGPVLLPTTTSTHVAQTSGYSSVYMNNRNYNIVLGGRTSRMRKFHGPLITPGQPLLFFDNGKICRRRPSSR